MIAIPVFYISSPSSFPYHFLLVFLPMPSMWACLFPFLKFPFTTFLSSIIHRPEKMYRPLSSVAAVLDVWDGRPLYHNYLVKMEIAKSIFGIRMPYMVYKVKAHCIYILSIPQPSAGFTEQMGAENNRCRRLVWRSA